MLLNGRVRVFLKPPFLWHRHDRAHLFHLWQLSFWKHLPSDLLQALQSLSLADSRLRQRGTVLVNALGSNACLRKVDLSGNLLEDSGAKMLSKALQINTTLRCVSVCKEDSPCRSEDSVIEVWEDGWKNGVRERINVWYGLRSGYTEVAERQNSEFNAALQSEPCRR